MIISFDFIANEEEDKKHSLYCTLCEQIATIIDELDGNNIFEQFYFFCYLLWNGYLSIDKYYEYSNVIPSDELLTIFLGSGCCRHDSKLLNDILNYYREYDSKLLGLLIRKMSIKNIMNISQNISKTMRNDVRAPKPKRNNHQVVLTKNDNDLFLFDATNLMVCEILNKKVVCYNGIYKVNKKLLKSSLNLPCNFAFNQTASINTDLLKLSFANAEEKCHKESSLIEDFYTENHKNYEKVKELVINIKSNHI